MCLVPFLEESIDSWCVELIMIYFDVLD